MERKVLKITKSSQFEKLVAFLHEHPDLAKGKGQFGSSKKEQCDLWEHITSQLNTLGPPTRTPKEWQRVWIHYKANLKRKLANNIKNIRKTGGGPSEQISLTKMEKSVLGLIDLQKTVDSIGVSSKKEQPTTSSFKKNVVEEENLFEKPPKKKMLMLMDEYLKTQSENQIAILNTLKRIEEITYQNYEINRKIYELKTSKYPDDDDETKLHSLEFEVEPKKEISDSDSAD